MAAKTSAWLVTPRSPNRALLAALAVALVGARSRERAVNERRIS